VTQKKKKKESELSGICSELCVKSAYLGHPEDARVADEAGSTEVRHDAEVLDGVSNAWGMGAAPWKRLRVAW
jgi:hypothetical protein